MTNEQAFRLAEELTGIGFETHVTLAPDGGQPRLQVRSPREEYLFEALTDLVEITAREGLQLWADKRVELELCQKPEEEETPAEAGQ